MSTFVAKFGGTCVGCDGPIKVGDEARMKSDGVLHAVCPPHPFAPIAADRLCPSCFMERSLSGACGCGS